jgi:GDP-4-dehydro-6-deoxy-D-mannose reductase
VARKSKILITGVAGFAGSHLAEILLSGSGSIYGILAPGEPTVNINHIAPKIKLDEIDIVNQKELSRYILKLKPNYIFHLAAMASVGQSIEKETITYQTNIFGTYNILQAARRCGNGLKKLILVSSSDCYGKFEPKDKILKETQPLNPVSPYGISKATNEYMAQYYFRQYGLPATIARSFNHTGPRQSEIFAIPSFCKQIALIERGGVPPRIMVGDLSVKRDLSDVRDIVRGYDLAARKGKPGEVYQLCSGKAVAIGEALRKLIAMSVFDIEIAIDKKRVRKSDIPILKGSFAKARKELGWVPRYTLDETLRDALQYWRGRVGK